MYYFKILQPSPKIKGEFIPCLGLWRRPACQTQLKAFDTSSAAARVAQDLLKAPSILSNTTVRKSAVE